MKPAQIKQLKKRINGGVSNASDVLEHYSTDGGVLTIRPSAAIYPYSSTDVQAIVKYTAEELHKKSGGFSLVARGKGTDRSGGALGEGAMVVFPAHMNRIKRMTKDTVTVQPGMLFGALQQVLHTHHRCLPPYPSSMDYSTVGGAVANNAGGEKSLKYGTTAKWVKSLKVVLDDGSEIETRRISKREVHRKKGLMTREGDLYRGIDGLLQDHKALIAESQTDTTKNASGYGLTRIKNRDGSIDLSHLFIGSQGTLGLITEITFMTAPYDPRTTLIAMGFATLNEAEEAILQLRRLDPSAMEMVDRHLLQSVRQHQPTTVEGLLPDELPAILLLVEFDNPSHVRQTMLARRAARIATKRSMFHHLTSARAEQERLWAIRDAAASVTWMQNGSKKALPVIEDACVPVQHLAEFLESTYKILGKHKLDIAVWGHAGDGNFHLQPCFDLSKAKERKKMLDVMDEFYAMVLRMGGAMSGEHNDGMLRAPYLERSVGKEFYSILKQVKELCDPNGIFNPRAKFGVSRKELEPLLRHEYSLKHLYDHFPHT